MHSLDGGILLCQFIVPLAAVAGSDDDPLDSVLDQFPDRHFYQIHPIQLKKSLGPVLGHVLQSGT